MIEGSNTAGYRFIRLRIIKPSSRDDGSDSEGSKVDGRLEER